MKKLIVIFINILLCSHLAAQTSECAKVRTTLRQKKEAFMTQAAQLTAEEAKQFFPLYFELHKRQNELKRNAWKCLCNDHMDEWKESDYDAKLHQLVESDHLIHELDQLYLEKYKKFLTAKKIYHLMKADIVFNRRLLRAHPNHKEHKPSTRK